MVASTMMIQIIRDFPNVFLILVSAQSMKSGVTELVWQTSQFLQLKQLQEALLQDTCNAIHSTQVLCWRIIEISSSLEEKLSCNAQITLIKCQTQNWDVIISKRSSSNIFIMEIGMVTKLGLLLLHFQVPIQLDLLSQQILAMMVFGEIQPTKRSSTMTTSGTLWHMVGYLILL